MFLDYSLSVCMKYGRDLLSCDDGCSVWCFTYGNIYFHLFGHLSVVVYVWTTSTSY